MSTITYDNVEAAEERMMREVEKIFNTDIDTIIKAEHDDLPFVVLAAEEKYRSLMKRTYAGKNKWRSGAWSVIESELLDERVFIYDLSDITAVCTYAVYIEAAVLYLRDGKKPADFRRLEQIVKEDVRRLGAFITSDHAKNVAEDDQDLIFYAMTMCRLYMQRLQKIYPDTV